ncbi:MAG: response regulator [Cyclobacteriaceae bacterium]|jgi:DNA-binding response OmpR family regulator
MTRVLVVDDEPDICQMLCKHLNKLDYEAQCASSVKEAIKKLQANAYDLLFIDIDLTDGSGFDVISYLNTIETDIKIIVISAYHQEVTMAMELGAHYFIPKPFSIKAIHTALSTLNLLAL